MHFLHPETTTDWFAAIVSGSMPRVQRRPRGQVPMGTDRGGIAPGAQISLLGGPRIDSRGRCVPRAQLLLPLQGIGRGPRPQADPSEAAAVAYRLGLTEPAGEPAR